MNWRNVKLIFGREVRDQLRDRRTLFMIAVLPILLYPLIGISLFQLAQFLREHPTRILVVGGSDLGEQCGVPLFERGEFSARLFHEDQAQLQRLLALHFDDALFRAADPAAAARRAVGQGDFEAVVFFPPDFAERLEAFRQRVKSRSPGAGTDSDALDVPSPMIYYNTAREASRVAHSRVSGVLDQWIASVGQRNLRDINLPARTARPFRHEATDVAESAHRDAAVWAKTLPFVLVIWALTGAFYPAIDLCAGEKERGTLETLLSSPAQRSEIVLGKLLTVILFSIATAVLNLASMGLTGALLISNLEHFSEAARIGTPPLSAALWLALALLPLSALFSALCLALAAFARSSKEGQYYLMPLILITLPLIVLPMSPAVELTLGNALIPVAGLMLLLRETLQGNYQQAAIFAGPVILVTLGGCALAIRWAIDQFNSETVLFRESERIDLGLWLRHLLRDRLPTPTVPMAIFCGVVILMIRFFTSFTLPIPSTFAELVPLQAVVQIAFIATPALLMTVMLTRGVRQTLRLVWPPLLTLPAVIVLALGLHPVVVTFQRVLVWLYPIETDASRQLAELILSAPNLLAVVLLLAVLPAICEEVAFRGFILSGLRHIGFKWRAILISSLFFGASHLLLQQSLMAVALGVVIGYIAVQTGSLLPCILYHVTHNAMTLLVGTAGPDSPLQVLLVEAGDSYTYHPAVVLVGGVVAVAVLAWLRRLPYSRWPEEALQEALLHPKPRWMPGA
jgi:sodium transport system permease protein